MYKEAASTGDLSRSTAITITTELISLRASHYTASSGSDTPTRTT